MRQLRVMVIVAERSEICGGSACPLRNRTTLYALVGRPKVLAATCVRMHSSVDTFRSVNYYVNRTNRINRYSERRPTGQGVLEEGLFRIVAALVMVFFSEMTIMTLGLGWSARHAALDKQISMPMRIGRFPVRGNSQVCLVSCMEVLAWSSFRLVADRRCPSTLGYGARRHGWLVADFILAT